MIRGNGGNGENGTKIENWNQSGQLPVGVTVCVQETIHTYHIFVHLQYINLEKEAHFFNFLVFC